MIVYLSAMVNSTSVHHMHSLTLEDLHSPNTDRRDRGASLSGYWFCSFCRLSQAGVAIDWARRCSSRSLKLRARAIIESSAETQ